MNKIKTIILMLLLAILFIYTLSYFIDFGKCAKKVKFDTTNNQIMGIKGSYCNDKNAVWWELK